MAGQAGRGKARRGAAGIGRHGMTWQDSEKYGVESRGIAGKERNVERGIVQRELLAICKENHGVLRPEDVVERAKNSKSPLHPLFTWDDTAAAREYRIWQARELIRVSVITLPEAPNEPIRTFVSLMSDRRKVAGGYRCLTTVLSNSRQRAILLEQALKELKYWEKKYKQLTELAPIFAARETVARRKRKAA